MRDDELHELIYQVLLSQIEGKDHFCQEISESTLFSLIKLSTKQFMREPTVLELRETIKVIGDIHGDLSTLLRLFQSFNYPPESRYLLLGDYIDRGKNSIEVLILLYALKLLYPRHIYLIRGNHETPQVTHSSQFRSDCVTQLSKKAYSLFVQSFSALPLAAVVNGVFCVHGGISPSLPTIASINAIRRPFLRNRSNKNESYSKKYKNHQISSTSINISLKNNSNLFQPQPATRLKESKLVSCGSVQNFFSSILIPTAFPSLPEFNVPSENADCKQKKTVETNLNEDSNPNVAIDLFWSDPSLETDGFCDSPRGIGYLFGKESLDLFLVENDLKGIVRGHSFCKSGYCWPLGLHTPCLTLFSSSNYCGCENPGAIAIISSDGVIRPFLIPPGSPILFPEWLLGLSDMGSQYQIKENDDIGYLFQCISV